MNIDTGGAAFPPVHDPKTHESGMTLRDYFAGQVMSGQVTLPGDGMMAKEYAKAAYQMADAMIAAREATQ